MYLVVIAAFGVSEGFVSFVAWPQDVEWEEVDEKTNSPDHDHQYGDDPARTHHCSPILNPVWRHTPPIRLKVDQKSLKWALEYFLKGVLIHFFVKHLLWYQMEAEIKLYNHENSVGHKSGLK